jgi:glycosyl transferase, family 25
MTNIDIIYYINLSHRTDRREQFLQVVESLGIPQEKLHRIEAVYNPECGVLGCCRSHLRAIEHFIQHSYERCIVFEDDVEFHDASTAESKINEFLAAAQGRWDLVMLGANVVRAEAANLPLVKKVYDAQTTSAYLLNRSFAPNLLNNFREGAEKLEAYLHQIQSSLFWRLFRRTKPEDFFSYGFDIYWKRIQPTSRWYVFQPTLCYQRKSYSDILKTVSDYKC